MAQLTAVGGRTPVSKARPPVSFLPEVVECSPDTYTPAQYQSRMPKTTAARGNSILAVNCEQSAAPSGGVGVLLVVGGALLTIVGHPYIGLPLVALGIAACGTPSPECHKTRDTSNKTVEICECPSNYELQCTTGRSYQRSTGTIEETEKCECVCPSGWEKTDIGCINPDSDAYGRRG